MRPVLGSFTRPNNTTQYASGDVINDSASAPTPITFSGVGDLPGGGGLIVAAALIDGAAQATKLDGELWLFDTAPALDNDNAPFTPTDAELQALIGVIDLGDTPVVGDATSGIGGNCVFQSGPSSNLPLPFKCVSGSQALYGVIVARNAYTPVALETFAVRLWVG